MSANHEPVFDGTTAAVGCVLALCVLAIAAAIAVIVAKVL